jgi:hypothetical protein
MARRLKYVQTDQLDIFAPAPPLPKPIVTVPQEVVQEPPTPEPPLVKALVNGETVLTGEGWKPIESTMIGDRVAGADGALHVVTGIYPPICAALPESMLNVAVEVVVPDVIIEPHVETVADVDSVASSAEAVIAMAIARWETLVHLWEGGTPEVCAPYVGNAEGNRPWKARWMSTADAERVLAMAQYTLHCHHEGPFPGGGGPRRAKVWRRADSDKRTFAAPLAVVAVELGVPELLDSIAVARRNPVP